MRHPRKLDDSRRGFSLLEMVVVLLVLGMLLTISAGLIIGALTTYSADHQFSQRILAQKNVADLFREDVAAAAAAPHEAAGFRATERCLILRRPDESLIIYHVSQETLERHEQRAGNEPSKNRLLPLATATVTFQLSGPGKRLVTLRHAESRGGASGQAQRVLEFSAALGGDRQ